VLKSRVNIPASSCPSGHGGVKPERGWVILQAADIFPDVQEVIGRCDSAYVFRLMSDAIEALANKAPQGSGPTWQPLLIYVNIPTTQGYYVTLPSQVETCLRVNLNKNPAFPRAQLYEFSQNGPGSDDRELGWSWQERGDTPLQQPIAFPAQLGVVASMANDAGLALNALCVLPDGTEQWVTYVMGPTLRASGPTNVTDIAMISKPLTTGPVQLFTSGNILLASYQPNDLSPVFQRIKLSEKAVAVRILAKRRSARVSQPTDIIPLNSKLAIVLMAKAIKYYKEDHFQEAATCEQRAIGFLEEEQNSRLSYSPLSSNLDQAQAISANIRNRDTLIVADVYDEATEVFGPVGRAQIFDEITTTIELLANKTHWDPLVGYIDICVQNVDSNYYVTLPRFIDQVIAMNINGIPGDFRSKWFEFHLNGLGTSDTNRPCTGWEEVGEVCTTFQWPDPVNMVAVPDFPSDNEAHFRIYGLDATYRPLTMPDGSAGIILPCVAGSFALPSYGQAPILTIDRIEKAQTQGFVSLYATDGANPGPLIGYYWPEDTEPIYRRIKLGAKAALVRMRYRKRWTKIASLTDPIPLRSRLALICAFNAVNSAKSDPDKSNTALNQALGYLNDEWRVAHPRENARIQINSLTYGGAFSPMT